MNRNLIIAVDAVGPDPIVASALLFDLSEEEPIFTYKDHRNVTRKAKFFSKPKKAPPALYSSIDRYFVKHTLSWSTVRQVAVSAKKDKDAQRLEAMSLAVVRCLERHYCTLNCVGRDYVQIFVPGKHLLPTKLLGSTTQIRFAEANWQVGAARLLATINRGKG
jgi:hypothetical protein